MHIHAVTIVVPDYDEAISFYVNIAGFMLISDIDLGGGKRWVLVSPGGATHILLAKAVGSEQTAAIGNQTGGRVGFFLHSDDFAADYARMKNAGVQFLEEPRHEPYGDVVVWADPWGNKWDLLQLNTE